MWKNMKDDDIMCQGLECMEGVHAHACMRGISLDYFNYNWLPRHGGNTQKEGHVYAYKYQHGNISTK